VFSTKATQQTVPLACALHCTALRPNLPDRLLLQLLLLLLLLLLWLLLPKAPALEELYVSQTSLSGQLPDALPETTNLRLLYAIGFRRRRSAPGEEPPRGFEGATATVCQVMLCIIV
jgi:hypothetical protein